MKKILSFGGGLQTTALAIMAAKGQLEVDEVIFADTGAEKPETYWYMESYIKPMLAEAGVPFISVRNEQPYYQPDLYGFLFKKGQIPNMKFRECTDHFKIRPIRAHTGKDVYMLIGFSFDEVHRANRRVKKWRYAEYPLIDQQLVADDCREIIRSFGLPLPLKSSCFICPYQKPIEWNWLKNTHPDLFQKAIELEANYHKRRPDMRNSFGLLNGTPLWKIKEGLQPEMFQLEEQSCWSGHYGHYLKDSGVAG